jgi:hypothetical protein
MATIEKLKSEIELRDVFIRDILHENAKWKRFKEMVKEHNQGKIEWNFIKQHLQQ